jgi:branched-chain amino acid transport system substrate-binding protein
MKSHVLAAALAAGIFVNFASAGEVKIGSVTGITGPLALTTTDILKMTYGYLEMINDQGGVNGNKLTLVTRDDGYDPKKTAPLVEDIIEKDRVVALVNGAGTSNTAVLTKTGVLNKHKVPLVGVFSGSEAIRGPGSEQIFHTRPSYNEEIVKICRLLSTLGLKRVAVLYQEDAFGASIMDSVTKASQEFKFDVMLKQSYKFGESDFAAHANNISGAKPQAILLMGVPEAVYRFMKAYDAPTGAAQIYALSFVTPQGLVDFAGQEKIRGIGISQVVPNPNSSALPLSREFKAFMQTPYAKGAVASPLTFEAFLNVRLAVEAIRLAGPQPTAEKVTQALTSMKDFKLGGFAINFTDTNRRGSSYLDIAVIGRNARLSY